MANKYMKCCISLLYKRCTSTQHLVFISPHFKWPHSRAISTHAGDDEAKQEPLYSIGGNTILQPLWKASWRFLKELKLQLPYDPMTSLLDVCPKEG
jgi:hypothetical protein